MSKIIRTQKPSVLPFYAMALVFLGLCAVLPVYKLWALLAALGGAFAVSYTHLTKGELMTTQTPDSKPRALIAMSGGVDSSVAAWLMQQAGYDLSLIHIFGGNGADVSGSVERPEHCCVCTETA